MPSFRYLLLTFWAFVPLPLAAQSPSPPPFEIAPIAPLPKVLRDLIIETAPSGLPFQIFQGDTPLACKPANVSPCSIRILGYSDVFLRLRLTYRGLPFEFRRQIIGRDTTPERWFVSLPLSLPSASSPPTSSPSLPRDPTSSPPSDDRSSSTLPSSRLPEPLQRPLPPTQARPPLIWPWIVLGIAVASGLTVGIILAVTTQDHLGLKCRSCAF